MSEKKHREEIETAMRALGTYRKEFDAAIILTAKTMDLLDKANREIRKKGFVPIQIKETKGGYEYEQKSMWLTMAEGYRKEIMQQLTALGLTPAGLKKINDEMKKKPPRAGGMTSYVRRTTQ